MSYSFVQYVVLVFFGLTSLTGEAQDHSLDFFIHHAKSSSPLLADYQNQVRAAGVDSELIKASYKVQLNGISNDYYAPVINGVGYDNIVTNGGQMSAQVQASKTFVSGGNMRAQYMGVRLQQQILGNTAVLSEKDLTKTITGQYILVYGDLVNLNFGKEILELLQKEEVILKKLTTANTYRQSDYLTFYVTLQQQQLLVRQTDIQYKNDYATLNYMAGIVDTNAVPLVAPDLSVEALRDIQETSFYRQYTLDSLSLLNQKTTIDYSYKPKVNVFADGGYNSSLMFDFYKNFGAGVGLNLSIPIYDGKQKRLKYQKVDIAERTRQQYKDFFLRQHEQQIAQLMQQLRATESLIADINEQIKYTSTLIRVNQQLLGTGEVRITDLILSTNTFLNARNLLNQNYINRMQIINQINYWKGI